MTKHDERKSTELITPDQESIVRLLVFGFVLSMHGSTTGRVVDDECIVGARAIADAVVEEAKRLQQQVTL